MKTKKNTFKDKFTIFDAIEYTSTKTPGAGNYNP